VGRIKENTYPFPDLLDEFPRNSMVLEPNKPMVLKRVDELLRSVLPLVRISMKEETEVD
jgi:hypothetical protein